MQHDALGVSRPEARVNPEDSLELLQQCIAKRENLFVCGQRHGFDPQLLVFCGWTTASGLRVQF
jgi:hypothetical protein